MRMRKLKWAEPFLEAQSVIVRNCDEMAGQWRRLLNQEELHVEIGSGKGDYWIKMSELYPNAGWIGIEKNVNVAAIALKKVENSEHLNRRFIVDDAQAIDSWFAKDEVDVIHLNFSDPWPKKRASKHRLSHASFLRRYEQILKPEGKLIMKTDNVKLFEFSILEFQNNGWLLDEFSVDYRRDEHPEDVITEYEHRFMELNQPIYRAVWHKA